jgi:hypothetical protein
MTMFFNQDVQASQLGQFKKSCFVVVTSMLLAMLLLNLSMVHGVSNVLAWMNCFHYSERCN